MICSTFHALESIFIIVWDILWHRPFSLLWNISTLSFFWYICIIVWDILWILRPFSLLWNISTLSFFCFILIYTHVIIYSSHTIIEDIGIIPFERRILNDVYWCYGVIAKDVFSLTLEFLLHHARVLDIAYLK